MLISCRYFSCQPPWNYRIYHDTLEFQKFSTFSFAYHDPLKIRIFFFNISTFFQVCWNQVRILLLYYCIYFFTLACPSGFVSNVLNNQEICYYFHPSKNTDRQNARTECNNKGGSNLATFSNQAEFEALKAGKISVLFIFLLMWMR